jgi:hypothetical protein
MHVTLCKLPRRKVGQNSPGHLHSVTFWPETTPPGPLFHRQHPSHTPATQFLFGATRLFVSSYAQPTLGTIDLVSVERMILH